MLETIDEVARVTRVAAAQQVVVVGAGSAGVAAAVSAAETGASTMLVEASGTVGGTLVNQLLESSAGFHDVRGVVVAAGIGQRLIDRLHHYGGTPGHVPDHTGYSAMRAPVNHAELSLCEAVVLGEAGVRLLLNAAAVGLQMAGDRVEVLVVDGKAGRLAVRPQVVIDCTGDADAAALAGSSFQSDAPDGRQPASLLFKLGGLDFERLLEYARTHREDFREGSEVPATDVQSVHLWGFGQLMARAHAASVLEIRRSELHLSGWPSRGEAVVNVTRTAARPFDAEWSGRALSALSRQVLQMARFFREYVPGGANAYVAAVASSVGVRESRRIRGEYTLTEQDVRSGATFRDSIGRGGFPIDVHDNQGLGLTHAEVLPSPFDIPYRCLVPTRPSNMLVAGRPISTTHLANGSTRQTAQCFVTGEAAGVAAALCCRQGMAPQDLPIELLQQALADRGVVLGGSHVGELGGKR
jgi:FAD dependent oxidoreductase